MSGHKLRESWPWADIASASQRELNARLRAHSPEATPADLREWWIALAELVRVMRTAMAGSASCMEEAVALEPLGVLERLAGDLGAGQIPRWVRDVQHSHRSKMTPTEQRAVELAVAYHTACKDGLSLPSGAVLRVRSKSPTKDLCAWYKVTPDAVRKWIRTYSPRVPQWVNEHEFLQDVKDTGRFYASRRRPLLRQSTDQ